MKSPAAEAALVELPFYSIRNISCPEDLDCGRSVYTGHLPIQSVLNLPSHENVRGYLRDAEGKERRVMTQVHRAILNTLREHPDMFSVLNGGLVIVARDSEVDEKQKKLKLLEPSIINGSQTQGVIRDFLQRKSLSSPVHVKFELIITADTELVGEISIARNFQNDVESISIAGRRGQLDEIEQRVQSRFPEAKLRKSETQRPAANNEYLDTEKLLQALAAMLPAELWWKPGEPNKAYAYSQRAMCLKEFQQVYESAQDTSASDHDAMVRVYNYYLDLSPDAWALYQKWKSHPGFAGTAIRSIERDGRDIVEVPDGIIFPIIAAHSEFVSHIEGEGWRLKVPAILDDAELIRAAKAAYMEIARSRPEIMGKTKACYSALQQITAIYRKFS